RRVPERGFRCSAGAVLPVCAAPARGQRAARGAWVPSVALERPGLGGVHAGGHDDSSISGRVAAWLARIHREARAAACSPGWPESLLWPFIPGRGPTPLNGHGALGMTSNPLRAEADRNSVLLVIASLGGGGAERQLSEMANYWAAKHWQVALATWSGADVADFYPLEPGVRRISLAGTPGTRGGSRIGANVGRIMRLRRLLISTRPQAVLSFMTESNLLSILAGTGLPVRVVVSERVQPAMHHAFPRAWRILRRALSAGAQDVVAQTRDAADWLDRNCHTSATVIPNALRGLPEPPARREELIVAAGRLTRQKGF